MIYRERIGFIMSYGYTIEDLSKHCKVSKQSIYNLIRKDKDFIKANCIRQGKKIKYNQQVLNKFLSYYGIDAADDLPQDSISASPPQQKELPQDDISTLKNEIETLKKELERIKAENNELIKQNGQVLLLLQEEKNEKLKLLPAPKKTIRERFGIFRRNQKE